MGFEWEGERENASQTFLLGNPQRQQPWWEHALSPRQGSSQLCIQPPRTSQGTACTRLRLPPQGNSLN